MLISVIIPHLNQEAYLTLGLEALHAQRAITSKIEIIVVDNGSARLPSAVCSAWPDVRLVQNRFPARGRLATAEFARRAVTSWHSSMPIAGPIPVGSLRSRPPLPTDIPGSSVAMFRSVMKIRRGLHFSSHMKASIPIATASTSQKGFREQAILQRCRRSSQRSDPSRGSRLPRTAIGGCAPARQAMRYGIYRK